MSAPHMASRHRDPRCMLLLETHFWLSYSLTSKNWLTPSQSSWQDAAQVGVSGCPNSTWNWCARQAKQLRHRERRGRGVHSQWIRHRNGADNQKPHWPGGAHRNVHSSFSSFRATWLLKNRRFSDVEPANNRKSAHARFMNLCRSYCRTYTECVLNACCFRQTCVLSPCVECTMLNLCRNYCERMRVCCVLPFSVCRFVSHVSVLNLCRIYCERVPKVH